MTDPIVARTGAAFAEIAGPWALDGATPVRPDDVDAAGVRAVCAAVAGP